MEKPWESLDIDETDLSTSSLPLLRRCNNLQSPPPPAPSKTTTTLSPHHTIPGPAAAVQAAMHRHNNTRCLDSGSKRQQVLESPISTQEFILRVEQDSGDDFLRNPWLFALHSLPNHGVGDATSLRDIKNCVNAQRIDKVVAIVKSCTQNGFGDMKITLKDPTDTIDAFVHGKVLNAGEYGILITAGSVLILQKVVVFSSSYMSCYLNVTRRNIAKIISEECEVYNFAEAYHDSTPVLSRNSALPERTSALVSRRSERVAGDEIRTSVTKGNAEIIDVAGNESQDNSRQSKYFADKTLEEPVHDLVDSGHSPFGYNWKRHGDHSGRTSQLGPGSLESIFRNLQDLDCDVRQQPRECSSAPSLIENLGSRNWQGNDAQTERLPLDCSRKRQEARVVTCFAPDIVEKLAKRDISELNGGPKLTQVTVSGGDSNVVVEQDDQASKGANGLKKQRLALVSTNAVQEWTDEQLCILDMDED